MPAPAFTGPGTDHPHVDHDVVPARFIDGVQRLMDIGHEMDGVAQGIAARLQSLRTGDLAFEPLQGRHDAVAPSRSGLQSSTAS